MSRGQGEASAETDEFIATLPDGLRGEAGDDRVEYDAVAFAAALLDKLGGKTNQEDLVAYENRLNEAETYFDGRLAKEHVRRHLLIETTVKRLESVQLATECAARRSAIGQQLVGIRTAKRSTTERGREAFMIDKQLRFLSQLARVIEVIARLRQIEEAANQALGEGDFSGAQTLCKAFDSLLNTPLYCADSEPISVAALACVHTISERVGAIAVRALKKVHSTMEEMCRHFDAAEYSEVLLAYRELNAGTELVDRIFSEYEQCIRRRTLGNDKKGKQLVQEITRVFGDFADILISFYKLLSYHNEEDDFEKSVQRQLSSKVAMLWLSVDQQSVEILRSNQASFSNLKPQLLSTAYNTARRLTALGRAFATGGDESPQVSKSALLDIFRSIVCRSFEGMHRQNQELIGVMLKNETWAHCDISPEDLKSIKFQVSTPLHSDEHFEDMEKVESTRSLLEGKNVVRDKPSDREIRMQTTSAAVNEKEFWESSKTFTPSSLAVLRSLSSYLQIGKDLPPLAVHAADAAADIVLLYMFTVTEICSARKAILIPSAGSLENYLSEDEQALLKQLRNRYRPSDSYTSVGEEVWSEISSQWNAKEFFSKTFSMSETGSSNLLTHVNAFVAVESMFCLKILVEPLGEGLHEHVEGRQNKTMIQRLLRSILSLGSPIRKAAYRLFAVSFGGGAETINRVASYSYDLMADPDVSLPSHHIQLLNLKYRNGGKELLPAGSSEIFWPLACRAVFSALVRGFARLNAVSDHGITQMMIDVRALESSLQRDTGLDPVPGANRAIAYVEGFRLKTERRLREWFETTGAAFRFRKDEVVGLAMQSIGRGQSQDARSKLIKNVGVWFDQARHNFANERATAAVDQRGDESVTSKGPEESAVHSTSESGITAKKIGHTTILSEQTQMSVPLTKMNPNTCQDTDTKAIVVEPSTGDDAATSILVKSDAEHGTLTNAGDDSAKDAVESSTAKEDAAELASIDNDGDPKEDNLPATGVESSHRDGSYELADSGVHPDEPPADKVHEALIRSEVAECTQLPYG